MFGIIESLWEDIRFFKNRLHQLTEEETSRLGLSSTEEVPLDDFMFTAPVLKLLEEDRRRLAAASDEELRACARRTIEGNDPPPPGSHPAVGAHPDTFKRALGRLEHLRSGARKGRHRYWIPGDE